MAVAVVKAEVCGAPFVALVGYSEEHVNEVGKFCNGVKPDDGLPGGGGADAVEYVGNGFRRGGRRYEAVVDQEAVEMFGFGGIEGVTVEVGFVGGQVGQVVGDSGEKPETGGGLQDVVVGVGYEGDDVVELDVLLRRKMSAVVVGSPLAAYVADLCGSAFGLAVDEFEKELELGGCEAQFDEFGGNGFGGAGLKVAEELGEGDGAQAVVKGEGCPGFGGCKAAEFG